MIKKIIPYVISIVFFGVLVSLPLFQGGANANFKDKSPKQIKAYLKSKTFNADPSMMTVCDYELFGPSGKRYFIRIRTDVEGEGLKRGYKECTRDEAIDMLLGKLISRKHKVINDYESYVKAKNVLDTCTNSELESYMYGVLQTYGIIDNSSYNDKENKLKAERDDLPGVFYFNVEKDKKWIEENILSQE
jgi:hypothetical protein